MIEFIRRHLAAFGIAVLGIIGAVVLSICFARWQIGIGPEFILKIFCKLVYVGAALMVTHFVIKHVFPTIYKFCYTKADTQSSEFMRIWWTYETTKGPWDQRLTLAVLTHIGIFAAVCILLALAF